MTINNFLLGVLYVDNLVDQGYDSVIRRAQAPDLNNLLSFIRF
jgi:hypothetical protein